MKCLEQHNKLRQLHNSTDNLVWDDNLQIEAQKWADYLISNNSLSHERERNIKNDWGENLFASYLPRNGKCVDAIHSWWVVLKRRFIKCVKCYEHSIPHL